MTETDPQNGSTDAEDGFAGSIVNEPRTAVPNLAAAKVDGLGCHSEFVQQVYSIHNS